MKTLWLILGIALLLPVRGLRATDSVWNYTVEIGATVQSSPAQIALSWVQDTNGAPASYTVYRKAPAGTDWGNPLATLSGGTLNYTDTSVAAGTAYEYQIVKDFSAARGYWGYGYIQAGADVPLTENRGKVILVVDSTLAGGLSSELQRLAQDLAGDGWTVLRHDVGRGDSVTSVKALIKADYTADPANVNAVLLFGHVPVPYSGALNPDGHPGHLGAWPADVYYADMDGTWTDTTVTAQPTENTDPADVARLTNVPGDGKFDQSTIPGSARLMIGRVDLSNLPGFLQYQAQPSFPSELELHRRYLNKDHAFRTGALAVQRRALIGDYSGDKDGLAVAASGFRSFSPIVGQAQINNEALANHDTPGLWLPELQKNDYLFALGAGAGSYTTVSGIGLRGQYFEAESADLVSYDIHAVFVMLFGSWCGDWDNQDNILRSVLATPTYGLAAMYTGVPHWYLHPMGLGETIGYCTRLTQNNPAKGLYQTEDQESARGVHIALMGDPTLRLNPVLPPGAVGGTSPSAGRVDLTWAASADAGLAGYHVFRATNASGPFTRVTSAPVTGTSFSDTSAPAGAVYMVRAVKREVTASGSYLNESEGMMFAANNTGSTGSTGSNGSTGSTPANTAAPAPHLVNLSVRALAGGSNPTLALGFVIGGGSSTGSNLPVLIRATGPALLGFGVTGVLADPVLTVYQNGNATGGNDNWGTNAAQVTATGNAVGAFPLMDSTSKDAALVSTCALGPWTAQVTGGGGSSGDALVEVYDASPSGSYTDTSARLINLSARTQVGGAAGALSVGFVVVGSGTDTLKVLVRAVGPGLQKFGVTGVLARPQVSVVGSDGKTVASNTGWGGDTTLAATFSQVGAFALDAGSTDSAVVVALKPGAYTAQITGADGGAGVALAEMYEVR